MSALQNIFVVDHEPIILELLTELLTDEGYKVQSAPLADGISAVGGLDRPALVLLDVGRTGTTGVAALQQLRTTTQYTGPIIAMSATLQKADLFLSAGATAYLAKPFTIEGLLTLVQQYVEPQPTVGAFV
jgi:two-component system, NtrC family, nitrogen regulation response regulator NtrX